MGVSAVFCKVAWGGMEYRLQVLCALCVPVSYLALWTGRRRYVVFRKTVPRGSVVSTWLLGVEMAFGLDVEVYVDDGVGRSQIGKMYVYTRLPAMDRQRVTVGFDVLICRGKVTVRGINYAHRLLPVSDELSMEGYEQDNK